MKNEIGVIGLAVMGKNLALNIESRGYSVSVYNRSREKTDDFINNEAKGKNVTATFDVESFINSLESPRKILLMVKAGQATDSTIESLMPYLNEGDILIDGGNTLFKDTIRRNNELSKTGIHFIGAGISGGEEGALYGPSIMPGGQKSAYDLVSPIFNEISAKVGNDPCVTYIGENGAGHYVKMVHNGIEYGDMQLIAESYAILKHVLKLSDRELSDIYKDWNQGELDSFLIEITSDIFKKIDPETNQALVNVILDKAGQKGTGKWTSQDALELGISLPTITEAVFARCISAVKEERVKASKVLYGPNEETFDGDKEKLIEAVRKALYMSKICSYAQGFAQMKAASQEYDWNLDYGDIAMIWRGGCIIRARFLENINEAFKNNGDLDNLLMDDYFKDIANTYQSALREVVVTAVNYGIPTPGFSSAINYYDSYRSETVSANLIQAQRDYFGAHTYERTDKKGVFHSNWLEK